MSISDGQAVLRPQRDVATGGVVLNPQVGTVGKASTLIAALFCLELSSACESGWRGCSAGGGCKG